jgi:hypothetical protein
MPSGASETGDSPTDAKLLADAENDGSTVLRGRIGWRLRWRPCAVQSHWGAAIQ